MKILMLSILLVVTSYAYSNESQIVQVASLTVKERIKSMEEINVTAKNPSIDKPVKNSKIENILAEAQRLEAEKPGLNRKRN